MLEVLRPLLYVAFTGSSLLLVVVILLQEGKGGGLAAAFGGAGGEAFGVGSGGINKFTAWLAAIFIGTALLLAATTPDSVAPESDTKVPVEIPGGGAGPGPGEETGEGTG